jgi:hypothetical protein
MHFPSLTSVLFDRKQAAPLEAAELLPIDLDPHPRLKRTVDSLAPTETDEIVPLIK